MRASTSAAHAHGDTTASHPHHTANHTTSFRHFSNQLYCAGATEQRCPDGTPAGTCYWQRNFPPSGGWRQITAAEANRSRDEYSRRFPTDRWDPAAARVPGFRYFGPEAAARCVRGKRIHIAGDSTTRDTFYEFLAAAGHPVFSDPKLGEWPAGSFEPRSPISSGGKDRGGECMGNFDRKKICLRDERFPAPGGAGAGADGETRLSFQFLMQSNSSWEADHASKMLGDRRIDAAFVQCPIYEWFKPDAYDYSKSREERARVVDMDELAVGPAHWAGMGVSCAQYLETVVRPAIAAGATADAANAADDGSGGRPSRLFLFGTTPLPMWTRLHGTEQVESRVFESIHNAFGIRCRKHPDGAWAMSSRDGIIPIDRCAARAR